MTEKQKLDQLIGDYYYLETSDISLAEYLAKHNVIVLPCDVGATVYEIDHNCECRLDGGMAECYSFVDCQCCSESIMKPVIKQKIMYSINDIFHWWSYFGKTVFLTREEAEQALKARENNA